MKQGADVANQQRKEPLQAEQPRVCNNMIGQLMSGWHEPEVGKEPQQYSAAEFRQFAAGVFAFVKPKEFYDDLIKEYKKLNNENDKNAFVQNTNILFKQIVELDLQREYEFDNITGLNRFLSLGVNQKLNANESNETKELFTKLDRDGTSAIEKARADYDARNTLPEQAKKSNDTPSSIAQDLKKYAASIQGGVSLEKMHANYKQAEGPLQDYFNAVTLKVSAEILTAPGFLQARIFSKYLDIIEESVKIGDFSSGFALYSGLLHNPIDRLKINEKLSKADHERFKNFENLFSPTKNFGDLNKAITEKSSAEVCLVPTPLAGKYNEGASQIPKVLRVVNQGQPDEIKVKNDMRVRMDGKAFLAIVDAPARMNSDTKYNSKFVMELRNQPKIDRDLAAAILYEQSTRVIPPNHASADDTNYLSKKIRGNAKNLIEIMQKMQPPEQAKKAQAEPAPQPQPQPARPRANTLDDVVAPRPLMEPINGPDNGKGKEEESEDIPLRVRRPRKASIGDDLGPNDKGKERAPDPDDVVVLHQDNQEPPPPLPPRAAIPEKFREQKERRIPLKNNSPEIQVLQNALKVAGFEHTPASREVLRIEQIKGLRDSDPVERRSKFCGVYPKNPNDASDIKNALTDAGIAFEFKQDKKRGSYIRINSDQLSGKDGQALGGKMRELREQRIAPPVVPSVAPPQAPPPLPEKPPEHSPERRMLQQALKTAFRHAPYVHDTKDGIHCAFHKKDEESIKALEKALTKAGINFVTRETQNHGIQFRIRHSQLKGKDAVELGKLIKDIRHEHREAPKVPGKEAWDQATQNAINKAAAAAAEKKADKKEQKAAQAFERAVDLDLTARAATAERVAAQAQQNADQLGFTAKVAEADAAARVAAAAEQKVVIAEQKVATAEQKAVELDLAAKAAKAEQKVVKAEQKVATAKQKAIKAEQKAVKAEQEATEAVQKTQPVKPDATNPAAALSSMLNSAPLQSTITLGDRGFERRNRAVAARVAEAGGQEKAKAPAKAPEVDAPKVMVNQLNKNAQNARGFWQELEKKNQPDAPPPVPTRSGPNNKK